VKFKFNPKKARAYQRTVDRAVSSKGIRLDKVDDFIKVHKVEGFKPSTFAKKLQEDIQTDGTGSFVVDTLSGLAGKVFGKEKVNKLIYKVQKPLQQADVAVGKFVGKGPLKGLFTSKESRTIGKATVSGVGGVGRTVAEVNVDVDVPRFSAAFDKAKKMVMPLFASAYLYDKLNKNKDLKDNVDEAQRLMQEKKSELEQEYEEKTAQYKSMMYVAGEALEKSASEIQRLNTELQSALREKEQMKLFIIANQRSERSTKLAYEMVDAMMIKLSDVDSQIEKIMDMDDEQFNKLQEEVRKTAQSEDEAQEEGVDKLSELLYLNDDNYKTSGYDPSSDIDRMREGVQRVLRSLPRT
jgi:hypothetical protein